VSTASPNAAPALDARLMELETRVAFQEQALTELSDALAEARLEHARTHDLLSRALDDLRQMRGQIATLDPASEPPPPHY